MWILVDKNNKYIGKCNSTKKPINNDTSLCWLEYNKEVPEYNYGFCLVLDNGVLTKTKDSNIRKNEIIKELRDLDLSMVRPLRSIMNALLLAKDQTNTGDEFLSLVKTMESKYPEDIAKIKEQVKLVETLREEYNTL